MIYWNVFGHRSTLSFLELLIKHFKYYLDLFSAVFLNCVSPTPTIIDPTTILCATTRSLIKYRLVVIAGPLNLYAYTPYPSAPTSPANPKVKRKKDSLKLGFQFNPLSASVALRYKPVNWFASKSTDWFPYEGNTGT